MIMYPVSTAYRESVTQQVINGGSAVMTLYNINQFAQMQLYVSFDDALWGAERQTMTRIPMPPLEQIATLEPHRMLADGRFRVYEWTRPPWYYISNAVSSGEVDANGEYPISGCQITLSGRATLLVDGIARVRATHSNAFEHYEYEYTAENGKVYIDCEPTDQGTPITVSILSLDHPHWRARIYGAYACAPDKLERWGGEDILDISYSGSNDIACLTIPNRELTVTVQNRNGISQERDIDNPRYTRLHTQAGLTYQYDLSGQRTYEDVPTGRWFLLSYKVTRETITYQFGDAFAVLSEDTHLWCDRKKVSLESRINEIREAHPDAAFWVQGENLRPTQAERYGIEIKSDEMSASGLLIGAPPPMSSAASLQLYANATGNALSHDRNNGYDISLIPRRLDTTPVLTLSRGERYGELEIASEDALQTATVATSKVSKEEKEQDLDTDVEIGSVPMLYTLNGKFVDIAYVPVDFRHAVSVTAFAWCLYLQALSLDGYHLDKLTVKVCSMETSETDIVVASGGAKTPFKNPLVDGGSVGVAYYVATMNNVLKYNVHYTIKHRGYPELDEGDIILVETEPGVFVRCLVEENKWSLKNGAKSGSTKVRRLK